MSTIPLETNTNVGNYPVCKRHTCLRGNMSCNETGDISYWRAANCLHVHHLPSLTQNPKMHSLHIDQNTKHRILHSKQHKGIQSLTYF